MFQNPVLLFITYSIIYVFRHISLWSTATGNDAAGCLRNAEGEWRAVFTEKRNFSYDSSVCESWKHSSYGNKISEACDWREHGIPIAIVSVHWKRYL